MKRLNLSLVILLFIIYSGNAFSQKMIAIGIGYGIGTHIKAGGIDFVLDRYNETRSYLSKTMDKPRFFYGFNYSIEGVNGKRLMTFEWVGRKSIMYAEGTDALNVTRRRDVQLKVNTFNWGFGRKLGVSGSAKGLYWGGDFIVGTNKQYTRIYESNATPPKFAKVDWGINMGVAPFVYLISNRLSTKFYIQFLALKQNYWDLNRAINPGTWSGDDYDSNKGKIRSIGLSTRFLLGGSNN